MHGKWKHRGAGLVAGLVLIGLIGVGGTAAASTAAGSDQPTTTFVGKVKGLDAFLAVVVDEDGAFAYLCDGEDVTDWFRGTNDKGAIDLGSSGGANLAAGVGKKKLDGIIVLPDGTTADFVIKKSTKQAGLFRVEQVIDGVGFAAGWVVLPDGTSYGKVETANLANAPVLPPAIVDTATPTTTPPGRTLPNTVAAIAPVEIAKQFPAEPPADSEVEVVPFTTGVQTDQSPGGGGNTEGGDPGDVGDAPPKDIVPVACVDPVQIGKEIAALQASLSDAPLLKLRAIRKEIKRLQGILENANMAGGQLNCVKPLR